MTSWDDSQKPQSPIAEPLSSFRNLLSSGACSAYFYMTSWDDTKKPKSPIAEPLSSIRNLLEAWGLLGVLPGHDKLDRFEEAEARLSQSR